MSEQPREHDKIRVTVVGEYSPDHDGDAYVLLADDVAYPILADATVEVLERADDPSKSLRGEVRECEPGLPSVCYGKDFWIFFRADGGPGYSVYRDVQMVGKPVIGAVPGTPAAEADKPERQVPLELRQKLADVLVSGDKDRAIRIALNWGMDYDDAVTYIESMPEYQTGRNHRPVDEVALPPLHVDNDAIVTGRYPEVSGSGVPHPPLDNEGIETGLYFAEKKRRRAAGEVV